MFKEIMLQAKPDRIKFGDTITSCPVQKQKQKQHNKNTQNKTKRLLNVNYVFEYCIYKNDPPSHVKLLHWYRP